MGVGRCLLEAALSDLKEEARIYLHAQESAVAFYGKRGFSIIGEPFWEAGIVHYKMVFAPPSVD
jgi:predicted GNAT family N-acyltransferase